MDKITSMDELNKFIESNSKVLLLVSTEGCTVCDSVLYKINKDIKIEDNIKFAFVKADEVKEVKGKYLIFTAPVILLLYEGREIARQARFIKFDLLENDLEYLSELK